MRRKKIILIILGISLLVLLGFWAKGQLDIDRCLDSGGRWNYETSECEYK